MVVSVAENSTFINLSILIFGLTTPAGVAIGVILSSFKPNHTLRYRSKVFLSFSVYSPHSLARFWRASWTAWRPACWCTRRSHSSSPHSPTLSSRDRLCETSCAALDCSTRAPLWWLCLRYGRSDEDYNKWRIEQLLVDFSTKKNSFERIAFRHWVPKLRNFVQSNSMEYFDDSLGWSFWHGAVSGSISQ
jgi:hypothetical protein